MVSKKLKRFQKHQVYCTTVSPVQWFCIPRSMLSLTGFEYLLQVKFDFRSKWFNLGWSVISLSLVFIIINRDKEITNQPRLKSFWPEIKFNLQHIHPGLKLSLNIISMYVRKKCQIFNMFIVFMNTAIFHHRSYL